MSRVRPIGVLGLCWLVSLSALAQAPGAKPAPEQPMPRGPAEIIQQTQKAQRRADAPLDRKLVPAEDTPAPAEGAAPAKGATPTEGAAPGHGAAAAEGVAPSQATAPAEGAAPAEAANPAPEYGHAGDQPPVGADPHAQQPGAPPLERRPIASAEPNTALPAGVIRVRVLDAAEKPVRADLQLGTMKSDNTRSTQEAQTNSDGGYRFEKLPVGDQQAYRVNVLYNGAKYSSSPFRLPMNHGFDVVIRRLETTKDTRELVLYVGATSVELRDERLKIIQQARLINIGSKTIVFPEDGQLVKLPPAAIAFQSEEVMSDQQLRDEKGQGFRILGSITPGETTLTWGFDLPHEGSEMDLSFELPWITFAYRVLADAAPGMTVEVDGMPTPELQTDTGRRYYVTEVVKRVGETPLRTLKIHVRGIPGPGPTRIVALVLALIVLGFGVVLARKSPAAATAVASGKDFERRKAELLARASKLETERARGEIGPEYHAEQLSALEEELAALLFEQGRASGRARSAGAVAKSAAG